jgi:hypothetical protein
MFPLLEMKERGERHKGSGGSAQNPTEVPPCYHREFAQATCAIFSYAHRGTSARRFSPARRQRCSGCRLDALRRRPASGTGRPKTLAHPGERHRAGPHTEIFFFLYLFYENQKIKEVTMPRGGRRPGAGRPRKAIPPVEPSPFDLTDRLNLMPRGNRSTWAVCPGDVGIRCL